MHSNAIRDSPLKNSLLMSSRHRLRQQASSEGQGVVAMDYFPDARRSSLIHFFLSVMTPAPRRLLPSFQWRIQGGHGAMPPPLWPDHENFLQATLYKKVRFFAIFQQELQNSTMFDGLFSHRYNMRLKSPCEIASDMTPASSNAFENQLQAV